MAIEFTELTKLPLKVPGLLQVSDPVTGACLVLSGPDLQVLYWANQPGQLMQGKGSPTLQRYLLERPATVFVYAFTRKYTGREVSTPLNKQLEQTGQHFKNYLTGDSSVDICLVETSTGHRFYCTKSTTCLSASKCSQLAAQWNAAEPPTRKTRKRIRLAIAASKHWTSEEFKLTIVQSNVSVGSSKQAIKNLIGLDRTRGLTILE